MPTSKSRLAYPDCESFLNAALEDEVGARLPFLTEGQAMQFRVRLNTYRTIVREDNADVYPSKDHPLHGRSEYDPLSFTVSGPDSAGEYWVYARRNDAREGEIERLSEIEGTANG